MRPLQPAKIVRAPIKQFISEVMGQGYTRKQAKAAYNIDQRSECFRNDEYVVLVKRNEAHGFGENVSMVYLSIRRDDRKPIRNWRDMQQIKNQLVGPECEGFELYPAESRVADYANQYHMFVFTDPEARIPVGFQNAGGCDDVSICGSVNEPLEDSVDN